MPVTALHFVVRDALWYSIAGKKEGGDAMRILAADYGDARTGLAICDSNETIASPVGNAQGKGLFAVAESTAETALERGAGMIVVGLPLNMDGSEGPRAAKCRKFASALERELEGKDIEVVLWDERSTTVQAYRNLLDADVSGKKKRGIIDSEAARIILDSYLAFRRNRR